MRYIVLLYILLFVTNSLLWGENEDSSAWITQETQDAIEAGLKYLIAHQEKDGSFTNVDVVVNGDYRIAVTSFACLSLMANGSLPDRGRYGENVAAGLDFILKCAEASKTGYITRQGDDSRMHGHGFATLFLAQVYGNTDDPKLTERVRSQLEKAVQCIIKAQTAEGGWGYYPTDRYHEGSITVCQLQALRAARDVGIAVPKVVIDNAIGYLKASANYDGTFKYRLDMPPGDHKSFALTAAGVSSLNATGEYEMEEITKGLEFMIKYRPPDGIQDKLYLTYYYYGHFYAAQAMYHAPPPYWEEWYPAVREDLLLKQGNSGEWGRWGLPGETYFGKVYATAIATLILQIPYNYLPVFQK